ncbi:TIGR02450 family Trp-rich protein [Neptunomonas antarctica]|uniref:TIGR02450 family Trp-rich protein n=1 Tax=Neptunomonas antarctica TaxID=619304 RepID=A0A1N7KIM5_9GAMM|nr:TIGR02450 family Trp-rich protein [Neptunomonas antarctica]SIS61471.1 tryptophan-rich conserved hypothetical protein [Neptunomonas antarctica]
MHTLNPKKLKLSKWTAVKPLEREKHFLVTQLCEDDEQVITACVLEAVISRNEHTIDWHELQNESVWIQGWV